MKRYKCNEEMHSRCSNNALCHLCDGIALFKDPKAEFQEKMRVREENKEAEKHAIVKSYKKEKKEGMGFEKRVAGAWNSKFGDKKKKKPVAKPRISVDFDDEPEEVEEDEGVVAPDFLGVTPKPVKKYEKPEAQRQVNSGAMWHSKGDIKLHHALMECKERGSTNSRGEKTISIPKAWLEKQELEAFQEQRPYWYLPFGYKNDEAIYLIKPYDHELELVFELRQAREEIERLQKELEGDKNAH